MHSFSNLSIRNKILFIALVGGLGLSVNIYYTHTVVKENSSRLNDIKNIYFPEIEKADASIAHLDKIKHLFSESITSGETIFITSAETIKNKMHKSLMGIATISPEKNSTMLKLINEFDSYYASNKILAEGIINGKLQSIELKGSVDKKNTTYKIFEESLFRFRDANFKKFSSVIEETDTAAQNSLDIGIIIFIIVGWLLMFSTLAVITTLNDSFLNVINSLKNMAERKLEKISRSKPNETKDAPLELIEIEKALNLVTSRFIETEKEVWELNLSLQDKVDAATSQLLNVNKKLESAVREANQANKAKSAFLANMSHELRTPMNAIIGYGELMEEDIKNKEYKNISADIENVRAASKHLLSLISDVLDLSKIEAGKMDLQPVPFDLTDLTNEIEGTIKPLIIQNNNKYTLNFQTNASEMFSDMVKLKQILLNLLSNACKFTHEGEIGLSITSHYQNNIEYIDFEITDTGIGIRPEEIKHLFGSFTQADSTTTKRFGGTGLGLAISKKYAQIMGGDIQAESKENIGSKFVLTVPMRFATEMAS